MRTLKRSFAFAVILSLGTVVQSAAERHKESEDKWDVEAPLGPTTEVEFVTDEGTWMDLDVSPDGREIAFDLLGDIYIMPISGGRARLLRGGPAFEVQPRFSPDGRYISYTSDKGGGDNIWIMNRDGSDPHPITEENYRLLNNAVWTPDGNYIVAKKHFTSRRSLGAGEMWLYHISGGKGIRLTVRKNDQQDVGEPCVSPDGRYVYFSEDVSPGGRFEYNKSPYGQIYVIRRVDRETGEVRNIVTGPGGAVRPQVSPDGKYLAFVRRVRAKTVLYLHDLSTGEEWALYDGLYKDQQETWATFGVYPNYQWTPDGNYIVVWAKGKIWKVNVETGQPVQVPFEATVRQTINEALRFKHQVSPQTFEAKMIRFPTTSPDGRWLVFGAVGRLWKKRLPDGVPARLTRDEQLEFWPSFSPDGEWIVYTTWSDEKAGAIYRIRIDGTGRQKLTRRKGFYLSPSFSPDGKKIVYRRTTGNWIMGFAYGVDPGIYWIPASGGEGNFIRESGRLPLFSPDGEHIYFIETIKDGVKAFKSVTLDNAEEHTIFTSKYGVQFVPSPDGKWLAFTELFNCYVVPFPKAGRTYELSGDTKAIPVTKVTRDAGSYVHWSGDSKKLHWVIGPEYFTRELKDCFTFVEGASDSVAPPDSTGLRIGLTLKTDVPSGRIALVGARIITMRGDEVIRRGTILIEGNRIVAVGKVGEIEVSPAFKVIDVTGKTIMPGLVDVHAHMNHGYNGLVPQQSWMYLANLAFGVTTTHDPSNNTETVFTLSEMVKAGEMVGPRVFSTGTILYGAEGDFKAVVNSYKDAVSHLRRMKAVGALTVKSYNQPRREQRQQIVKAGRELGMMVVPEGASFFFQDMTMILDGHTGIEHTIPIAPIYNDVKGLWAASRTYMTPTLVVGYGGLWGENYWYQKTQVWKNKRLLRFVPRPLVDSRALRRRMAEDFDFGHGHIALARNCKDLIDLGSKIQLGAHGQMQGLGAHWELWMFVQGGMTNMEALRAATLYGAEYLGLDDDIGSLEPGKLADLIVLHDNPLEDIRNSEKIQYVMVNGRLFDVETMDEIGNHPRKRAPLYWERPRSSDAFVWRGEPQGFGVNTCGCFASSGP